MYHRIVFTVRNILLLPWDCWTGQIQPAMMIFSQVSLRLCDCKNDKVYSTHCIDKTVDDLMISYRECVFPKCKILWWIKWLSTVLGVAISLPPSHCVSDPGWIVRPLLWSCTLAWLFIASVTPINRCRVLLCTFDVRSSRVDNSDWLCFSWSM